MINIFLVDDHELVRAGVRSLLEMNKGIQVIGEAHSGEEAVKWCRNHQPDVVLMDISMPGIGGIEAARKILRHSADTRILILTMHTETTFPFKVMQSGVAGYLSKNITPHEMVNAIRTVYVGQRYITPEIAQKMVLNRLDPESENPLHCLSERELQIMMMITQGKKVYDIAAYLNLSPKTVNSYRYRIFAKLSISSDVELTHLAMRYHLLTQENL